MQSRQSGGLLFHDYACNPNIGGAGITVAVFIRLCTRDLQNALRGISAVSNRSMHQQQRGYIILF